MSRVRPYLIVRDPLVVKARDPFEAMKLARAERPELRERRVSVVARSLVRESDEALWLK